MRLEETMIVWTPNRDLWLDKATTGQVAVTTIPEKQELKAHPMSVGACDHNWRETDDAGRRQLLQKYFTQMIHEDKLDETRVREALSVIQDINPDHLSAAKPDPDDED
jgi:hypothetical protein